LEVKVGEETPLVVAKDNPKAVEATVGVTNVVVTTAVLVGILKVTEAARAMVAALKAGMVTAAPPLVAEKVMTVLGPAAVVVRT